MRLGAGALVLFSVSMLLRSPWQERYAVQAPDGKVAATTSSLLTFRSDTEQSPPSVDCSLPVGSLSSKPIEEILAVMPPMPMGRLDLLAESFLPTTSGLAARTIDLWSSREFLEFISFQGLDLPTRGDIERAMIEPPVAQLLCVLVAWEDIHSRLLLVPKWKRSGHFSGVLEATAMALLSAETDLMKELERVTGYVNWEHLAKSWRRWAE